MKWTCRDTQTGQVKILPESEAFNLDIRNWKITEYEDNDKELSAQSWPSPPTGKSTVTGKM